MIQYACTPIPVCCHLPCSFAKEIIELVDSFPSWMEGALKDLPQVLKQTKMKGRYVGRAADKELIIGST